MPRRAAGNALRTRPGRTEVAGSSRHLQSRRLPSRLPAFPPVPSVHLIRRRTASYKELARSRESPDSGSQPEFRR